MFYQELFFRKRRYLCPHLVKLLDEGLVKWEELPQRYREHPYFNLDRTEEIVTGPLDSLVPNPPEGTARYFYDFKLLSQNRRGLLLWVPLTALNFSRYFDFTPITRRAKEIFLTIMIP